jgi:hypothetical protein
MARCAVLTATPYRVERSFTVGHRIAGLSTPQLIAPSMSRAIRMYGPAGSCSSFESCVVVAAALPLGSWLQIGSCGIRPARTGAVRLHDIST